MQVLQSSWDNTFSEASYGFRPGRSAHQAVARAQQHIAAGHRWVVDLDLEKFFDRVNHDRLMGQIAKRVHDKRLLRLIRSWLKAGVLENGLVGPTEEGTPQGGPLSPLLSNLVLDQLDRELERRGHRFVRYADDCNIYVRSRRAGQRLMGGLRRLLEGKLKLKVNREKSAVARPWERKFLGFSFTNGKLPKRRMAPKAVLRFQARIRALTRRTRGISLETMVREVGRYLQGWQGYFGFCQTPTVLERFNKWIRRRLRSAACKQWRTGKTRFARLRKLDLSHDLRPARQGDSGVRGGLAAHKPFLMPCRPLTSIAWDFLRYAARPALDLTEPPCTDPYARWWTGKASDRLPMSIAPVRWMRERPIRFAA